MSRNYKTGEVANLAGITIRTLRYYDSIDLLKPSKVLANGHRVYDSNDVKNLQVILGMKILGFSLKDIQKYMKSPDVSLVEILKCQQQSVAEKMESLKEIEKRIAYILQCYSDKEEVEEKDVFAIYSMLQMLDRHDVLLQYFSPEEIQKKINNNNQDEHKALYEALKILGTNGRISNTNKAFVIDTFTQFIEHYFAVINEETIIKTCKILIEMLDNDPAVSSGALNEKNMTAWLCENLKRKED